MKKKWYDIRAEADETAEILIYDEISSWGVDAKQFVKDLAGVTAKSIRLRMNSPGGNVFDGIAIYNALKSHPATVRVEVDGLAASIASIIAMAGDTIHMATNAFLMIHNAWAFAIGDSEEMRKMADVLDKIDTTMVRTYADRSGSTARDIRKMMTDETWMTADEAKEMGFCDSVGDPVEAAAELAQVFDFSKFKYNRVPEKLRAGRTGKLRHDRDLEDSLRDAGLSRSEAKVAASAQRAVALRDAGKEKDDEETEYALRRCLLAFQQ